MWSNWMRSVARPARRPAAPRPARRPRLDALEDRLAPAAFRLGAAAFDGATAVVADTAGHVYVTGGFNGTVDFDPGPATFNLTNTDTTTDAFLAKYTAAGALVWAGQLVNTTVPALAVGPGGALHVTGSYSGTIDFDLGPGTANLSSGPSRAGFVAQYNPDSTFGWARSLGGQAGVSGDAIAVDAAGNVYSSGVLSNGTADFDPGTGTFNLTNLSGNANSYISKLTPAGNFVWARQLENQTTIAAGVWTAGLGVDAAQNVYLTGIFVGTVDFDPGPGTNWVSTFDTTFPSGDGYVAKLSAAGDFGYVVRIGSPDGREDGNGIAVDAVGNAFVTGAISNITRIDDTTLTDTTLTSSGPADAFILRLNAGGAVSWARQVGGTGSDVGMEIFLNGADYVYVTGGFMGATDFDPGPGTRTLNSAGSYDAFALQLGTGSASFINAWRLGGTNIDLGEDIAITSAGQVAVVGRFLGTGDFDPGPGTTNLTSAGDNDAFVTVFSPSGNQAPTASDGTLSTNEDTPATGTLAATDPNGDALTYTLVSTTNAHGTVTITNAATGAYSYAPDANYNGPASFTFKVNDGALDSNTATVTITVAAVNDAPVAVNDSYTTNEDVILDIAAPGLLGNDTDVENQALTAVLVAGPTKGAVVLNANGSFRYRPLFDFNGTDTFTYKARDSAGAESAAATVTITVNPVNDAPRPTPPVRRVTTNEDTAVGGQLTATDPEGDAFTFSSPPEFAPTNGTVVVNANGTWTYTPNANFYGGPDTFGYKVTDVHGAEGIGIVEVTVTPVNDAPVAVPDAYTVAEDGSLVIGASAISRLRMISEPGDFVGQGQIWDFNPTTAAFSARTNFDNGAEVLVDPPGPVERWTLNFAAPNEVLLTPGEYLDAMRFPFQDPGRPGLDVSGYGRGLNRLVGEFTVYDVAYGPAGAISRFAATFVQQNHPFSGPLGAPLYGAIVFNSTFGAEGGVLDNDTDVESELLLGATLVAGPANGSLAFNGDGTFTYTPNPNFHGTDTFTYRTADARADSNTATVTITVTPVNDAPVASDGSGTTAEDTPLNGTLTASDVDGDALTYHLVAAPSHGAVAVNSNGTFTYTPTANYNGPDSFTFKANDGTVDSNTATFAITVTPVNDAPVATNGAGTTAEDTSLNGTVTATDVDGDPLTYSVVAGPSHGTLTAFNATTGAFTYAPAANYNGPDSFTFKANDGTVDSNTATFAITVTPVNDAPVASDGSGATDEDTPVTGTLSATDVDGDVLTYSRVANPTRGTVVVNANGSFTYTPNFNFHGTDTFTFKANDGALDSNVATVTIAVRSVNDHPVATDDAVTTSEDTAVIVGVLDNDTDVDGDVLTVTGVTAPAHGTAVLNTNGTVTYTPNLNFHGADSFAYTISDGQGGTDTGAVAVTVRPVNDAPVATDGSAATNEDSPVTGTLTATDVDGDTLTFSRVAGPAHGTVTVAANGTFTYTPAANFHGTDTFTFRARDAALNSNVATVTITVRPVNDAPVAANNSYTTPQNQVLIVPVAGVLANDTDVDGDRLSAVLVTGPTRGTLTLNADGSFRYTPAAGFTGSDRFTYKANDGGLDSNVATVTVQVTAARNTEGKVNGGGTLDGGARRFEVDVKSKPRRGGGFTLSGEVEYRDGPNGIRLESTGIRTFAVDSSGDRAVITGTAKVNGRTGYTFTVIAEDLGHPGKGKDTFRILITGPRGFQYDSLTYATAGGLLDAGNIHINKRWDGDGDDDDDDDGDDD